MKKIYFLTSDKVKIAGNWFFAKNSKKYAILLHMRPATKESWNEFAKKLNEADFSVLAIDLRGHGESTDRNGEQINYEDFLNGSHVDCIRDVNGAISWLKEKGTSESQIIIIGGSIGANLAINAMSRYQEIKKGIALSPGLEYLGVAIEDAVKNLIADQKLFMVASADDKYSYDSVKKLHKVNSVSTDIKLYENAGHATTMFDAKPELMEELINWLR